MKAIEIVNEEIFKIGKYEFIKFEDENGNVIGVLKNRLYNMPFGDNNDFAKSDILKRLNKEFLPEIESIIGAENILEFETDLISLDGSKKYGVMRSNISIPTFDFYRKNRAIFAKYPLEGWWWLATPDSTSEYLNDNWCFCVSPRGDFYNYVYCNSLGVVRPFLIFSSSIFESLAQ